MTLSVQSGILDVYSTDLKPIAQRFAESYIDVCKSHTRRSGHPFRLRQSLNLYPAHYTPAFAFSAILLPAPPTASLAGCLPHLCLSEVRQRIGFTAFSVNDTSRVGSASLPTIMRVRVFLGAMGISDRVPFGSSLSAPLACLQLRHLSAVCLC